MGLLKRVNTNASDFCSVLQCIAVCHVTVCLEGCGITLVCCSVLRCVAVCCGVLQCVAVCCSVLP